MASMLPSSIIRSQGPPRFCRTSPLHGLTKTEEHRLSRRRTWTEIVWLPATFAVSRWDALPQGQSRASCLAPQARSDRCAPPRPCHQPGPVLAPASIPTWSAGRNSPHRPARIDRKRPARSAGRFRRSRRLSLANSPSGCRLHTGNPSGSASHPASCVRHRLGGLSPHVRGNRGDEFAVHGFDPQPSPRESD